MGSGVDLTSSFLKILYIFFCAIHFLMFLFIVFFFLKKKQTTLLRGVLRCENKMKDILREAIVENITIMFCPLITIEGACDCECV